MTERRAGSSERDGAPLQSVEMGNLKVEPILRTLRVDPPECGPGRRWPPQGPLVRLRSGLSEKTTPGPYRAFLPLPSPVAVTSRSCLGISGAPSRSGVREPTARVEARG